MTTLVILEPGSYETWPSDACSFKGTDKTHMTVSTPNNTNLGAHACYQCKTPIEAVRALTAFSANPNITETIEDNGTVLATLICTYA